MSFRKVGKRKAKAAIRQKPQSDEEDDDDHGESTTDLLMEARKRTKNGTTGTETTGGPAVISSSILNTNVAAADASSSHQDLATSSAQHLPASLIRGTDASAASAASEGTTGKGADGIFRDHTRNKFHAGPIRAAGNIRVTARFDYQPDICKDYKETGFCGFGDTCIYLHDRGDTLAGWQLEQQWEEQQRKKKEAADKAIQEFMDGGKQKEESTVDEDGLPFACHLCRKHFTEPVVTNCQHYFCQDCILDHVQKVSEACPICTKDTGSVFNKPTKLEAKKRRALGAATAKQEDSWELFLEHSKKPAPKP